MTNEQERAEFEAWLYLSQTEYEPSDLNKREIEIARLAFIEGRSAMQSQDREDALRKAVDSLVDFAGTVAPSASFWDEVWPELEEAIEHARRVEEE